MEWLKCSSIRSFPIIRKATDDLSLGSEEYKDPLVKPVIELRWGENDKSVNLVFSKIFQDAFLRCPLLVKWNSMELVEFFTESLLSTKEIKSTPFYIKSENKYHSRQLYLKNHLTVIILVKCMCASYIYFYIFILLIL